MFRGLLLLSLLCILNIAQAEIYVTAPPLQSEDQTQASFQPLLKALSEHLGEPVILKSDDTWLDYSRNVQSDNYDLLLSEAHILSFLLLSRNRGGFSHLPIAHLPSQKSLQLVSNSQGIASPKQLLNRKICVKPSPSIDSALLYGLYSNPVSQPQVIEIAGNYPELQAAMSANKCVAAVLPSDSKAMADLPLNPIHSFAPNPQLGWTMSSRLSEKTQQGLISFFNNPDNNEFVGRLLMLVSESDQLQAIKPFKAATYGEQHKLLANVWGW